jgi:hypothetical protein
MDYQPTQTAAMVTFKPGTDKALIKAALKALADAAGGAAEGVQVKDYDPRWGGPVLYFP